ncbi:MAG: hypothetical protein EBR30_07500 [Cytophagia bacterium]|nr:hypothetical protein [Cytophagia bacterium]NBW34851.1 hypothetical protein [Cytophagia bacterium]
MSKAILEFDLNEERDEFQLMLNANKWYSVVWDIDQHLRSKTKYASDDTPNEIVEALYQVREELRGIMNMNGVSFE